MKTFKINTFTIDAVLRKFKIIHSGNNAHEGIIQGTFKGHLKNI
jgi:hypothetical protein